MTKRDYIFIAIGVIIIAFQAVPYVNKTNAVRNEINLIEEMRKLNREHTDELLKPIYLKLEEIRLQDSILTDKIKSTNVRIKEIPRMVDKLPTDDLYNGISNF